MDFDMLGLAPVLLDRLGDAGLDTPTPIQKQAIPPALDGRDVMGLAQTGTGKTAAFGLPLLHHLITEGGRPGPKSVRSLILAPTRELANQIADSLRGLSGGAKLSLAVVVGGQSINRQINRMERGADILVATPGRLIDLLDRGALSLSDARRLVLDEADQMLDMGFIHALRRIATHLPAERQTLLFSATMAREMGEIAATYLQNPVKIEIAPSGRTAEKVTQEVHFLPKEAKQESLIELLGAHPGDRALVFARTKHGADRLMKQLERAGFSAAALHGNRSQGQRDRALKAFRDGSLTVLVATDVAARGIDIPEVNWVYNYDLPNVAETYVHRIGRTARAGREGRAIAFCAPDELGDFRSIEKLLGKTIPVARAASWSDAPPPPSAKPQRRGRRGAKPGARPASNAPAKGTQKPGGHRPSKRRAR